MEASDDVAVSERDQITFFQRALRPALAGTCVLKADGTDWFTLAEVADYATRRNALPCTMQHPGVLTTQKGGSPAGGASADGAHKTKSSGITKKWARKGRGGASKPPSASSGAAASSDNSKWGTSDGENKRRWDAGGCLYCSREGHHWGSECPEIEAGKRQNPSSAGNRPVRPLEDPAVAPYQGGHGNGSGRGRTGRGRGRGI